MYEIKMNSESPGDYVYDIHIEIHCLDDFLEVKSLLDRIFAEFYIKGGDVCNATL